ncbi:peroxin-2 [Strigomonas culicis]|uniref:RING-type E3 ubiquitin transferase (cysteine targeting) n=2 Tax=Strigomonas culicis TaxID=28005 RepID=S9W681_9TRYP|nr:peroxin-2 [Strigomonas culicis]|eukprot:EPY34741.1 peroxin-2 [Strigomonas culicis]
MSWVRDASEAEYILDSVSKQQQVIPTSHAFSKFPNNEVLRVFQLDALTTQEEIVDILRSSLLEIFNVAPLQAIGSKYQEELFLSLDLLLYRLTTWRQGQSIGDRLQNLVLRDEGKAQEMDMQSVTSLVPNLAPRRSVLLVHLVFSVLLPYAIRKLRRQGLEEGWDREEDRTWRYYTMQSLRCLTAVWSALSLLNILHFLATGHYRTMTERLLSLKPVYGSQSMRRFTNLFYLNQHMWWKTWASLFATLRIGKYLSRALHTVMSVSSADSSSISDTICCACRSVPTLPQKSNCGHSYCYYCIKSRLADSEATGSFRCCRCGVAVHACFPA